MSPRPALAADSRDSHLAVRRVERQHAILDRLLAGGQPVTAPQLAMELGVSHRSVVRDLRRLRESGVPLVATPGPHGGVRMNARQTLPAIQFEPAEVAALVASLAALGPTATEPAASAMRKLTATLDASSRSQP